MYGLNDRIKYNNFINNELASFFLIQCNGIIPLQRNLQF